MNRHMQKIMLSMLIAPVAMTVAAQEEEPVYDDGSVDCISLREVRTTDIVDDRNILFYTRGDVVYHNILPRRCGGLASEDRFSYKTSMGRLCKIDMIRVLYDDPFGMREGNACGLGMFHKITKEDAKALKEHSKQGPQPAELPMPEPEEMGTEDAESPPSR